MTFKTLEQRNAGKKQKRSKLVTKVAGTVVGLGLLTLLGLGVAGCEYVRRNNTEAANFIESKYSIRLDSAVEYLDKGDTVKARNIAIRTLNDIRSEKKNYDVGFGGYDGELPNLEADLSEIISYK
ncbi:hypothetical protein J4465_01190 [Candidatus Pacearchaeota archaeon]|nr:hypothetical protein [Candidatus Pacearchaeota archaeon]